MTQRAPAFGRCIFCGDYKRLTEEHIWPKWIRPYLKSQFFGFGRASVEVSRKGETLLSKGFGQGDPQRRTVTDVCSDCNNTWMSQLQTRAKSELIAMIEGRSFTLLDAGQRVVAAWVTMAVMAGEHFFDGSVAVPAVERLSLKLTSSPLNTWKIWAGSYVRGDWPAYFVHGTRALNFRTPAVGDQTALPAPNTQASSFVVGSIFFHAFSCPSVEFTRILELECEGRLAQIWPPRGPVAWPPVALSDLQVDRLSTFVFDAIAGNKFRGLPTGLIEQE